MLSKRPLTLFSANALAELAPVLGNGFYRYVEDVTMAFVEAIEREALSNNAPRRTEFVNHGAAVNAHVREDAVHALVATLCEVVQNPSGKGHAHDKTAAVELIGRFCKETKLDITDNIENLLTASMMMFSYSEAHVLKQAVPAAAAVMKHVKKEQAAEYIELLQSILREVTHENGEQVLFELPGLNVRGALKSFYPLLTEGLVKGNEKTKQLAASTMGTLVSLTASTTLMTYVMVLTGPLIRMASEQFSEGVKLAILQALRLLLVKCGPRVKAFFSALQTTFRKALRHKSKAVRDETVKGLAQMMKHNPRVDNVVQDLVNQAATEEDAAIKVSLLEGLIAVTADKPTGKRISKPLLGKLLNTSGDLMSHKHDDVRYAGATLFGSCLIFLDDNELESHVAKRLSADSSAEKKIWTTRQGKVIAMGAAARAGEARVGETKLVEGVVLNSMDDDNVNVVTSAITASKNILISGNLSDPMDGEDLLEKMAELSKSTSDEVKATTVKALQAYAYYAGDDCKAKLSAASVSSVVLGPLVEAYDAEKKSDPRYEMKMALFFLLQYHVGEQSVAEKKALSICKKMASKNASAAKALASMVKKTFPKITEVEIKGIARKLTR